MNDELLMNNYLLLTKSTVEVYVHGTLESSNKDVRNTLKDNLNLLLTCQANTYDKMTEYGFYPVENIDSNTINQTLTKLQSNN